MELQQIEDQKKVGVKKFSTTTADSIKNTIEFAKSQHPDYRWPLISFSTDGEVQSMSKRRRKKVADISRRLHKNPTIHRINKLLQKTYVGAIPVVKISEKEQAVLDARDNYKKAIQALRDARDAYRKQRDAFFGKNS